MTDAKAGDTVRMHYTGSLEDGTRFDSSDGRNPLEFTLGAGQIIDGLDRAVTGMSVGEQKQVTIPAEDAYGDHRPDRVQVVPRDAIPPEVPVDPGTRLEMRSPEGQAFPVTVTKADDEQVTLDANHPLAGKTLVFDVELVEIV